METFDEFNIWKPVSTKSALYSLKFESNPFCFYIFQRFKGVSSVCGILDHIAKDLECRNEKTYNLRNIFSGLSEKNIQKILQKVTSIQEQRLRVLLRRVLYIKTWGLLITPDMINYCDDEKIFPIFTELKEHLFKKSIITEAQLEQINSLSHEINNHIIKDDLVPPMNRELSHNNRSDHLIEDDDGGDGQWRPSLSWGINFEKSEHILSNLCDSRSDLSSSDSDDKSVNVTFIIDANYIEESDLPQDYQINQIKSDLELFKLDRYIQCLDQIYMGPLDRVSRSLVNDTIL